MTLEETMTIEPGSSLHHFSMDRDHGRYLLVAIKLCDQANVPRLEYSGLKIEAYRKLFGRDNNMAGYLNEVQEGNIVPNSHCFGYIGKSGEFINPSPPNSPIITSKANQQWSKWIVLKSYVLKDFKGNVVCLCNDCNWDIKSLIACREYARDYDWNAPLPSGVTL